MQTLSCSSHSHNKELLTIAEGYYTVECGAQQMSSSERSVNAVQASNKHHHKGHHNPITTKNRTLQDVATAQSSMHLAGPIVQHENQSTISADILVTGNLSVGKVPLQARKGVNKSTLEKGRNILERRNIPTSLN